MTDRFARPTGAIPPSTSTSCNQQDAIPGGIAPLASAAGFARMARLATEAPTATDPLVAYGERGL
jgi:hypothetical protein